MNEESSTHEQNAQATIAAQAQEIERLRRQLANHQFADELRAALVLATAAGTIASPVAHSRLLEMIVETAAHVISAHAASLFLLEEESQELIFEVALGEKADEVKKFRVPLGRGIAGLVAVSSQPIAIADAQRDPRFASDIGQSVGYLPQTILCVPLIYNDQTIGVLELLDKEGGKPFTAADMEALGFFANQAAVAIEQSRTHRGLIALMGEVLKSLGTLSSVQRQDFQQRGRTFVEQLEDDPFYRQATDLAQLVQEIVWQGEHEARLCRTILTGFADYLRSRPAQGEQYGTTW